MGLGILTAVFFIAECMLFVWNRIVKKKSKGIMKAHCILGEITLGLTVLHFFDILKLWDKRPLVMNIAGCTMCTLIIIMCILAIAKKGKPALHRGLALAVLVLLCLHVTLGIISLDTYKSKVADITISNVDVSGIADGSYEGTCDVGYIYAHVRVEVADGQITGIELLEHKNERGQAAESITESIVAQQEIDVDIVTSATNSSQVIKKAVENALESAEHEN